MDKLDRRQNNDLLSRQVGHSRYFFLNLAQPRRTPLAVVFGGREECNPDYAIRRASFPYHVVEFVERGRGTLVLDHRRFELAPGTVFTYAPTTRFVIRTDAADPLRKYFFAFRGRGVAAAFARAGLKAGMARQLAAPAEVASVCAEIVREGQKPGSFAAPICDTLVDLLWLKIRESLVPRTDHELARESYLRCKAKIDADAEDVLTLNDVARSAGVDASTVCRWFRRFQGISPYQYLLRRKMNVAAQFLIQNGGMVKEAALRVGFHDPYHFSRVFKAVHGVPPSALWARRTPLKFEGRSSNAETISKV